MLNFLMRICRFNFGDFEKEEFKKFMYMGAIFALIIGVYWTLRPLKDAIFIQGYWVSELVTLLQEEIKLKKEFIVVEDKLNLKSKKKK